MTNRIRDVHVINHRLDPHETELHIRVELESVGTTTEIKGRVIGPRSVHTTTVEIAYPMREIARGNNYVELRVVIPEACWWTPESPFLYHGPLELWEEGERLDRRELSHGITTRLTA